MVEIVSSFPEGSGAINAEVFGFLGDPENFGIVSYLYCGLHGILAVINVHIIAVPQMD